MKFLTLSKFGILSKNLEYNTHILLQNQTAVYLFSDVTQSRQMFWAQSSARALNSLNHFRFTFNMVIMVLYLNHLPFYSWKGKEFAMIIIKIEIELFFLQPSPIRLKKIYFFNLSTIALRFIGVCDAQDAELRFCL